MKNTTDSTLAQIPKNLTVNGFRHGLSQPSQVVSFTFGIIPAIDTGKMDDWLRENFEIDVAPYHGFDFSKSSQDIVHLAQFVWRVNHLANSLLQALRVPSFDPGCILSIEPEASILPMFKTTLLIPYINHVPFSTVTTSFEKATQALLQFQNGNLENPDSDQIFADLQKQFSSDRELSLGSESCTISILKSAFRENIPFSYLGLGIYQLGWGAQSRLMDRSSTELDSAIGSKISQRKHHASQILKESGFPVPQSILVKNAEDAIHAAHRIQFPVVIKPADKDRGEGVTINIDSDALVTEGYQKAAGFSGNILVEKQIQGVCHRIFIANDKHLFTVKRTPKSVKGDGVLTVEELISKANADEAKKPKHKRLKPFPLDELAIESITSAGYRLNSIPEKDVLVPLRKIESTEWGGSAEKMTDTIHPDNIQLAIQATRLLRLNVAGVDLMSTDVRIPWHQNGAALNEINCVPYLSGSSEESKKVISEYLKDLLPYKGRIPVEVFVGDQEAMHQGLARQKFLLEKGIRAHLTTHQASFHATEETHLELEADSLFLRCKALLMKPEVSGIILVIQTDEFAYTGLPVDSVSKINLLNANLTKWNQPGHKIEDQAFKILMATLQQYLTNKPK